MFRVPESLWIRIPQVCYHESGARLTEIPGVDMYSNPQKPSEEEVGALRRGAGHWLKKLREERGLSQRDLAEKVGVEYYTFISQVESGRGRIPPDRYRVWARALGVPARDFVLRLMRYYDPVTYRILFERAS
jgi:hypothetical protein